MLLCHNRQIRGGASHESVICSHKHTPEEMPKLLSGEAGLFTLFNNHVRDIQMHLTTQNIDVTGVMEGVMFIIYILQSHNPNW